MKVAVFDVDGTLITDNIGITFVKFLNSRSAILPSAKIVVLLGYILYKMKIIGFKTAIRLGYFALAGLDVSRVKELASQCFAEKIKDRIFADGIAEICKLKSEGWLILLATGAHETIATPFAEFLGADHLVCTRSVLKNGKYGWRSHGPLPYKSKKRDMVQQMLTEIAQSEVLDVTVYTDEAKDLPLLDLADHCIGVNADSEIAAAVLAKSGRLVQFR